jgi:hypothetical protein
MGTPFNTLNRALFGAPKAHNKTAGGGAPGNRRHISFQR